MFIGCTLSFSRQQDEARNNIKINFLAGDSTRSLFVDSFGIEIVFLSSQETFLSPLLDVAHKRETWQKVVEWWRKKKKLMTRERKLRNFETFYFTAALSSVAHVLDCKFNSLGIFHDFGFLQLFLCCCKCNTKVIESREHRKTEELKYKILDVELNYKLRLTTGFLVELVVRYSRFSVISFRKLLFINLKNRIKLITTIMTSNAMQQRSHRVLDFFSFPTPTESCDAIYNVEWKIQNRRRDCNWKNIFIYGWIWAAAESKARSVDCGTSFKCRHKSPV